ncbi:Crp/Fnr family transcriptional regulator [Ruminococcus albus]|uniref:cAMP-binding domain of CRP or a regulatory subunit of cAMP-dependent protein kinases n=1 Tax=Ruminococcus albus TaxID=1264 RepID=A0A1I1DMQ3_RUMAL|nr:Crp/Fnr family transcriptional regulator [Ruminococcus albus]SFB76171.1 cAMP-binding domain of CRP or a regulatory subunit of cAMP-dependent protein kinases [Ruminococcus albus]
MSETLTGYGLSADKEGSPDECLGTHTHGYSKGEMILRNLSDTFSETAIVNEGTVLIVNISSDGQKSILDICRKGDSFGCGVFPKTGLEACCAIAGSSCSVSYISYSRLLDGCEKKCSRHGVFIDSIIGGAARRYAAHIDILSRRTIREKLIAAFRFLLDTQKYTQQKLPVSLSELADYLCCDRSAMMREIKRLNDDGTLQSHGSRITLLSDISVL